MTRHTDRQAVILILWQQLLSVQMWQKYWRKNLLLTAFFCERIFLVKISLTLLDLGAGSSGQESYKIAHCSCSYCKALTTAPKIDQILRKNNQRIWIFWVCTSSQKFPQTDWHTDICHYRRSLPEMKIIRKPYFIELHPIIQFNPGVDILATIHGSMRQKGSH